MNDLTKLTLREVIEGLKDKKFSTVELIQVFLERIKLINPKLNAFLMVNEDSKGIPVVIKDIICTQNIKTTAGSKILSNFIPPYDATVINKLKEKNVGIIGKTNLDEFAMGSSGENSAFGVTKNPWDTTKVTGGSSSGSVAAVAADLCVFALGTDTGGSIRQPASLCGVVGLKPSYGRVSRYGSMAMASSLDQIGPITKTVADARMVLEWISGPDGYDSNCNIDPFVSSKDSIASLRNDNSLKGMKIGVPREYFGEGLDKGVEEVIRKSIKRLEDLGAEIVDISLPNTEYAIAAYYIVMPAEVSANLARFDGIRFGSQRGDFGEEVKRRIMLGTFTLSAGYFDAYFTQAAKVRTLIKQDFAEAFKIVDAIVGPVSPTVAWGLGEKIADPLTMYLSDAYTIPASLAGIPGLSVPCGFSDGMPVGLQILGKFMDEKTILRIGETLEKTWNIRKEKPKL